MRNLSVGFTNTIGAEISPVIVVDSCVMIIDERVTPLREIGKTDEFADIANDGMSSLITFTIADLGQEFKKYRFVISVIENCISFETSEH